MTERMATTIRTHRMMQAMTQAELARRAGVSRKSVNKIERGHVAPSMMLALKLARVLGLPVETLFYMTGLVEGEGVRAV